MTDHFPSNEKGKSVATGTKTFRIMVVDDEPEIAKGIADMLSAITEYHIEPFADPHQAIGAFQEKPYHLVLTDLRMPRIEGNELVKQIKDIAPSTKVIVMTALKDQEMIDTSRALGIQDIFYKPIDLMGIEKAVLESHEEYIQNNLQ
jgi:DNA-binding NtrC family response regulator